MDNQSVISNLEQCVAKIKEDIEIITNKRDAIPLDNQNEISVHRKLTNTLSRLIAEMNSLETIINERKAGDLSSFPPLDKARSDLFLAHMNSINIAIKADQSFDAIVAIADGIRHAADEIETITDV